MNARRRLLPHGAVLASAVAVVMLTMPTSAATAAGRVPPSSRKELVKILSPRIEPLGLHITRAALVDGRNRRSASGTHLALYVEPDGAYSPNEYLEGTATVSRAFLPFVFDHWPGLRSFDVCQEPQPEVDKRPEPPPETQVFVLRHGVDAVDWKHADLADLLAEGARASREAGDAGRVEFSVFIAEHLQTVPEFENAFAHAADDLQSTPTSSSRYR